jgi:hypothetical protein
MGIFSVILLIVKIKMMIFTKHVKFYYRKKIELHTHTHVYILMHVLLS